MGRETAVAVAFAFPILILIPFLFGCKLLPSDILLCETAASVPNDSKPNICIFPYLLTMAKIYTYSCGSLCATVIHGVWGGGGFPPSIAALLPIV